jgi:hypothetical protein
MTMVGMYSRPRLNLTGRRVNIESKLPGAGKNRWTGRPCYLAGVAPAPKKSPDPAKPNPAARVQSVGDATCGAFHGGIPVTDNRWELTVVTLVAIAVFFSVWHFVASLIG